MQKSYKSDFRKDIGIRINKECVQRAFVARKPSFPTRVTNPHFPNPTGNQNPSSDIDVLTPKKIYQQARCLALFCSSLHNPGKDILGRNLEFILRSASKYARLPLSGAASTQCLEEVASSKCTPTMTVVNEITACVHVCQKDCVGQ